MKKIYFVGIKGVGMASLAVIAKEAGLQVRGSDVPEHFITDVELEGIPVDGSFDEKYIDEFIRDTDISEIILIATAAHNGFENSQVIHAQKLGIKIYSHGQAVGLFMEGGIFDREFIGISVAGAHGKTTTSAVAAVALTKLERDPTYTIGTSEIKPIGFGGHYGKGTYFIAEADEYFSELKTDRKPKFLYQHPQYIIVNNIAFDHPDIYKDFDAVKAAYLKFMNSESVSKVIIHKDEVTSQLIPDIKREVITFGENNADFTISDFKEDGIRSEFKLIYNNTDLDTFRLRVPGFHNALNALGVVALFITLGIHTDDIRDVIAEFQGTKRRLELIGTTDTGSVLYDDYAHHPEEIVASIKALKLVYPDKKVLVVFQPHTYSRTESLMDEFGTAFEGLDKTIILPIFPSARESVANEEKKKIEDTLKTKISHAKFPENADFVVKYTESLGNDWVIVTMGAGDVYKVAERLRSS